MFIIQWAGTNPRQKRSKTRQQMEFSIEYRVKGTNNRFSVYIHLLYSPQRRDYWYINCPPFTVHIVAGGGGVGVEIVFVDLRLVCVVFIYNLYTWQIASSPVSGLPHSELGWGWGGKRIRKHKSRFQRIPALQQQCFMVKYIYCIPPPASHIASNISLEFQSFCSVKS